MKKKLKKVKKSSIITYICIFVLLVLIILFSISKIGDYKIEDRVKKITEYDKSSQKLGNIEGWLKVEGTNIDYPIIYNDDKFDPDKVATNNFAWTNIHNKNLPNRMFIVGHNLLNVSSKPLITNKNHNRFEQLMSFIYYDFAKENEYIQFSKNNTNYVYKIFSVAFVDNIDVYYHKNSYSKKELKDYINDAKEESYFKYNVKVTKNDKIITLITCSRFFGSNSKIDKVFKIDARLVRKGESMAKYEVTEKNNYGEIKKILKGGDSNE